MAVVDVDRDWLMRPDGSQGAAAMPRYPEDKDDTGYRIAASRQGVTRQSHGPEGLSLVARVYE